MRSTSGLGTDQMALVELEWAPAARPNVSNVSVALSEVDAELELGSGSEVPLDPLERDDAPPSGGESGGTRRRRDEPAKMRAILREVPYVLTPAYLRQVIAAALGAQGIVSALGRLDSLSSRARTSAMLPEVRLRAGRDVDQSLRLTPTTEDPYRYSQTGGVAWVMDGSVTWRLGRLLFATEELSIERLRLAQARERQRISIATMNELLSWQVAWRRLAADGTSTHAADDLAEATLRLDLMTGGWFSAHQPAAPPTDVASSTSKVPPRATRYVPNPHPPSPANAARTQQLGPIDGDPRGKPRKPAVNADSNAASLERVALSR